MYRILLADEEKQFLDSLESVMEKLEKIEPMIENGMIYSFLYQDYAAEDIECYKSFLGITAEHGYMLVLVCGDREENSHMASTLASSVKMQQYYSEIREIMKAYFGGIIGSVMSNKIAMLIPCDKVRLEEEERVALLEKAKEVIRRVKRETDTGFRIGIGGIKSFREMQESYREALKILHYSTEKVAHADDEALRCIYEEDYPIHLEKRLFAQVERGLLPEARVTAGEFFDWMAEQYSDSMMDIRLKVLEFVLWAEHIVYEKGGRTYRFKAREDYLPTVLAITEPVIMREWFTDKIADSCSHILKDHKEKADGLVEMARKYMEKYYRRDLSLEEVAQTVNVSPYYFSRIFKEDTGKNFVEYLTGIRIEKAKELLSCGNYTMKEICCMVGYSEPNYFSRSFKKNVGVTPTEYSRKILKNTM